MTGELWTLLLLCTLMLLPLAVYSLANYLERRQ